MAIIRGKSAAQESGARRLEPRTKRDKSRSLQGRSPGQEVREEGLAAGCSSPWVTRGGDLVESATVWISSGSDVTFPAKGRPGRPAPVRLRGLETGSDRDSSGARRKMALQGQRLDSVSKKDHSRSAVQFRAVSGGALPCMVPSPPRISGDVDLRRGPPEHGAFGAGVEEPVRGDGGWVGVVEGGAGTVRGPPPGWPAQPVARPRPTETGHFFSQSRGGFGSRTTRLALLHEPPSSLMSPNCMAPESSSVVSGTPPHREGFADRIRPVSWAAPGPQLSKPGPPRGRWAVGPGDESPLLIRKITAAANSSGRTIRARPRSGPRARRSAAQGGMYPGGDVGLRVAPGPLHGSRNLRSRNRRGGAISSS